jgi:hypothetical protein
MKAVSSWKLPPLLVCAIVALGGGLVAGKVTVGGMRSPQTSVASSALFGRAEAAQPASSDQYQGTASYGGYDSGTSSASSCANCSERDLGYRWAALAAIRYPRECPDNSWGFRRGCLDYVGGI